MRDETARKLAELTTEFYARTSASFSSTREAPWDGWQRILQLTLLPALLQRAPKDLTVLDLACGNLRFERFLDAALQEAQLARPILAYAYDNCDDLASRLPAHHVEVRYTHLDVVGTLLAQDNLGSQLGVTCCDLAVCFGFMHHLALPEHRVRVTESLIRSVAPGRNVALSFWQLSKSKRLLNKARRVTAERAPLLGLDDLGEGDYLLAWQDRSDVVRYCHDFTEADIDELVAAVGSEAQEVARFSADGAEGNLNRYLVLRRKPR